jgi:alkanesulfonate monooxygenase SsuD/methylene tetrahydromethanopterin reductase-like flavin-dependent oxidoreductase (luciferase family)
MQLGIIIGDERTSVPPAQHFDALLRQVEAAQRNGFTYITIGQHFLYGDLRWLQPIPTLARLAAEVDKNTRLVTTIVVAPLYHPVILAEELATLDIVSQGRLIVGAGLGYRTEEYRLLGVPFEERGARFEEALQLMLELWTQDEVNHRGRFWTVENAKPHLRPVQQPHMPLWLGAHKEPGVRRAARIADTWTVPPEFTPQRIAELIEAFRDERTRAGRPMPHGFPLRREVMLGSSREDALDRFAKRAQGRYIAYADRELGSHDPRAIRERFADAVKGHVVAGTAEQVIADLTELSRAVPVNPIMVRPHWPGMTVEEVTGYLDELGREVVPALRALEPAPAQPVPTQPVPAHEV